jgi:hypothetical protein
MYSPSVYPDRYEAIMVANRLDIDAMFIGHNVHEEGLTSLAKGRVIVFDPGMSKALYDAPATVLDMRQTDGMKWEARRIRDI